MQKAADYLIQAQKFEKRIDSYKVIEELPDNEISDRKLVKHRLTGEKFILKWVP